MKGVSRTIAVSAATALTLAPAVVWAQQPADLDRYACGPYMMHWGGGWFGMAFAPLFLILVLAVAIVVARAFLGPWGRDGHPRHSPPGRAPLDILRERYARGEIDKEEFDERRRVLGE